MCPMSISTIPLMVANPMTASTAFLTSSLYPCPISMAIITFGPMDAPTKKLTNIPTFATFAPTAARASLPAYLPTTATSAELNNCCNILLNASGSAKKISLLASGPCNISICRLFLSIILPLILRELFSSYFGIMSMVF